MDIAEYLDEDCDEKVTLQENGNLGLGTVLVFSISANTQIRIHPTGIMELQNYLDFVSENELIHEDGLLYS